MPRHEGRRMHSFLRALGEAVVVALITIFAVFIVLALLTSGGL